MFPEIQWKNISTCTRIWLLIICENTKFRQVSKWLRQFWSPVPETAGSHARHTTILASNVKIRGQENRFATPTTLLMSALECTIQPKILSKIILSFWHTDLIIKNCSH